MQYFLIYVLTLHNYNDIIMTSRKTSNKIKAHRAAGQSYTMSTKQNNMKGAYIITYVEKGVNYEQRSIREIKSDKNNLQRHD